MHIARHKNKSLYVVVAIILLVLLLVVIDFVRYPPGVRVSETESASLSEPIANTVEQHEALDASDMRLLETVRGDCRYCYVHTFEYDVANKKEEVGTLLVVVYTEKGEIQNVSVSQSAIIRSDWNPIEPERLREAVEVVEQATSSDVS